MTTFFDIFNEKNFEIDNQEMSIQPVTTSELKQPYPQLGIIKTWNIGEQAARKDGTIVSRSYKELTFNEEANDFDLVDAGYVDSDSFGGRYYWRVLHQFKETEYYSSAEKEFGNFKVWEKSINDFQMEITYDNLPTKNAQGAPSIVVWKRPTTTSTFSGTGCPILLPDPDPNETGPSAWNTVGTGTTISGANSNVNTAFTTCRRFNSLPIKFYLVLDAGKSLGISLSDADLNPNKVYISSTPTLQPGTHIISTASGTESNPHKMRYRYLILEWDNPEREELTTIKITFRGNERYRSFLPLIKDQEPEYPEHLESTPYIAHAVAGQATRYKPPGLYNFPDNFWNDVEDIAISEYSTRTGINPTIL